MDIYIVIIRRYSTDHKLIDEFLVGTYSSLAYSKKIISDELARILQGRLGVCGLAEDVEVYTSWGKDILKLAKVLYPGRVGIIDDYVDVYYIKRYNLDDEPDFDYGE